MKYIVHFRNTGFQIVTAESEQDAMSQIDLGADIVDCLEYETIDEYRSLSYPTFTCTFSSLGSCLSYTFYLNLSTGYYEIESLSGVVKDSGYTLGEPSWESSQGIIQAWSQK